MPEEVRPDSVVEYTIKELLDEQRKAVTGHLDRQDVLLRDIARRLDSKADKSDLVTLGNRLDLTDARVDGHDEQLQEIAHQRAYHRRAWAVAGALASVAAIIIGSLIGALVH